MWKDLVRTIVITTAAVWTVITPLWAHHLASAFFDMAKRISVTGTLTKVDSINPHVLIALKSKDVDEKIQQWMFESNPPSWYRAWAHDAQE